MAITVKHSKVSTIPDDADTSLVRPSDWNADHALTGVIDVANGGTGAATLTGYVKGNGTSAMTASATVPSGDITGLGTMSTQNANAVAITGGTITGVSGLVTSVTGTSPVVSSGGTTPAISMPAATGSVNGYLTSADWTTFNGKGLGTVTSVAATVPSFLSVTGSPITSSGTLALAYSGTALPVLNGGTGATTSTGSGAVVLDTSPTISGLTTTGTLTGAIISANGAITFSTTASTVNIGTSQVAPALTIGGTTQTGILTVGRSTVSQTTNIQAGITASGSTKTMNIGTAGAAGSTTTIAIGSTTGTSTTTVNGILKQQTYTVATLPSASTSGVGSRSFVTDALAPAFGATVVTGGAIAVPVYSDGTNWKVG